MTRIFLIPIIIALTIILIPTQINADNGNMISLTNDKSRYSQCQDVVFTIDVHKWSEKQYKVVIDVSPYEYDYIPYLNQEGGWYPSLNHTATITPPKSGTTQTWQIDKGEDNFPYYPNEITWKATVTLYTTLYDMPLTQPVTFIDTVEFTEYWDNWQNFWNCNTP